MARITRALPIAALVAAAMLPASLPAQSPDIAGEAVELLKTATSHLAGLKQFSVDTDITLEVVLHSGQKIQLDHAASMSLQRPDKLRSERRGELVDQIFYYNGKTLTLEMPAEGVYATVAAPATIEGMLDFASDELGIFAPAADLVYQNAFDILMDGVTSGFVVGRAYIEGAPCVHLAFRKEHTDWQIWIQEGEAPLPRKFVVTSVDMPNAPQFSVVMRQWNTAPVLADAMFEFKPAEGARQIEFLSGKAAASEQ